MSVEERAKGAPRMQWTPALRTGVELIDAQHRELFAAVNALLDGIEAGRGPDEVAGLFRFLEGYTTNHFGEEEIYMRRHLYPGYPAHKAEHTAFVADFIDIREECEAHGPTPELVGRIRVRVCDWLVAHIGRVDMAFAAYLAEFRKKP